LKKPDGNDSKDKLKGIARNLETLVRAMRERFSGLNKNKKIAC